MQEITGSVVVDASPEHVFGFLDDWRNLTHVFPRLQLVPLDDEHLRGKGARFKASMGLVPGGVLQASGSGEIVEHYYPERLELRLDPDEFGLGFTLGRVGGQTLVQCRVTMKLPAGAFGHYVGNALAPMLQRDVNEAVAAIKRGAESGT